VVEAVDQLSVAERLTAPQLERPREHTREDGLAFAVEPLVDEPREADVVIAGEKEGDNERHRQYRGRPAHPSLAPDSSDTDRYECRARVFGCQNKPPQRAASAVNSQPRTTGSRLPATSD